MLEVVSRVRVCTRSEPSRLPAAACSGYSSPWFNHIVYQPRAHNFLLLSNGWLQGRQDLVVAPWRRRAINAHSALLMTQGHGMAMTHSPRSLCRTIARSNCVMQLTASGPGQPPPSSWRWGGSGH
jgi:hypothetical protein